MDYLLYYLTFFVLILGTALYVTRNRWLAILPTLPFLPERTRDFLYERLPIEALSDSFAGDVEAGLSSNTFDLGGNVAGGDARAGLDDTAKAEILKIMKTRRLRFDKARQVYTEQRFKAHGIGPDGRPRDPKFVSFS